MKTGMEIETLADEVLRQSESARDYLADTSKIDVVVGADNKPQLAFGDQVLGINKIAHDQIASHVKMPRDYYGRCETEAPGLLANNVNTWFRKYPAVRMLRVLDGNDRAFVSDRFRALDNWDLLKAALPKLRERGVKVLSCNVSEEKMFVKVVDERMMRDLPVGWSPNNKGHGRFDTVAPALTLSNSEVGHGALSVAASVYYGGCTNLVVLDEGHVRKYHVGGKLEVGEDVYRMLSDRSKRLSDAALWSMIGDVVGAAFDQARFDATCDKLTNASREEITGDPIKVVEVTAKKYNMTDDERKAVLKHLVSGGDLSKYGLQNAITRTAEDLDSYDRASHFEQVGGRVLELPKMEWERLAEAA